MLAENITHTAVIARPPFSRRTRPTDSRRMFRPGARLLLSISLAVASSVLLMPTGCRPRASQAPLTHPAAAVRGSDTPPASLVSSTRGPQPTNAPGEDREAVVAAVDAHTRLIKHLLGRYAPADEIAAAKKDDAQRLKGLLQSHSGANVNARAVGGETALMIAAERGHTEVVEILVGWGADCNARRTLDGATALILAAGEGHAVGVYPAGTKAFNRDSANGLVDGRVVALLLEHGADPNATTTVGETALLAAADAGLEEAATLLLKHGALVDARNAKGQTALFRAAAKGHTGIVRLLLDHLANPNVTTASGETPLWVAADAGRTESVKLLLDKGAVVDARSDNGDTALMAAAWQAHTDIVRLLVAKGADIHATTLDGETALTLARWGGHPEIALLMQPKGTASEPATAGPPTGQLAPVEIQRVMRANYGRFQICYERGLGGGPNLEGRIAISFVIGTDGRVSRARDGGSDIADGRVIRCVVEAVKGVSFPRPQGGPLRVVYPIMFSPG